MRWPPGLVFAAVLLAGGCLRASDRTPAKRTATAVDQGYHWTNCPRGHSVDPHRREVLPALIEDGDAVFFIGNSFLGWEGRMLPEWLTILGRAVSPPIRIETGADILFGNTPLRDFLDHPATRQALASRRYKVFVLQGEEMEPVDHKAAFHQGVRELHRAIVAAGATTVLFMTWEFPWRPFLRELAASYDEIGRELGIPVIPVGLVYQDYQRSPAPGESPYALTADPAHPMGNLHENEKGTAINVYATFAMLTGRNPLGQPFPAPGNTNSPSHLRFYSDLAWRRVLPRLETACR
jgi:hypothetical protein